jgi:hypothetical protein
MDNPQNQIFQVLQPGATSTGGRKTEKVQKLIADGHGGETDPHFAAFFRCFNTGQYFEAHEVLEVLWLKVRGEPIGDFYKGLIQLAGAFVHLKKDRLSPGVSLFKLARANLAKYPNPFQQWPVDQGLALIDLWLNYFEENTPCSNPLLVFGPPKLPQP